MMALSGQDIEIEISRKCGVTAAVAGAMLDALATMAHREAQEGFLLPGIGRLVVTLGPRQFGRNPATGAEIRVPRKKKIEFLLDPGAEKAIVSHDENPSPTAVPPKSIPAGRILPEIHLTYHPDDVAAAELDARDGGFNALHKIGGEPDWVQGPEENIVCCGREMTFYGQFDSINQDIMIADAGVIYVYLCFECWKARCFVQYS